MQTTADHGGIFKPDLREEIGFQNENYNGKP